MSHTTTPPLHPTGEMCDAARGAAPIIEGMTDPSPAVDHLVDHLFRAHYRYLTTVLTASLGPSRLAQIEDAVSEALLRALKHWPYHGVPAQPRAWLLTVARRQVLDALKHEAVRDRHAAAAEPGDTAAPAPGMHQDEELAMIFMACHPVLPAAARVGLTLKVVCGFSVGEIARAFLAKEATIAQRLVRARRALAGDAVAFEVPADVAARLPSVLDVLYLMFTEGHMAHAGDHIIRRDICDEALRLVRLLTGRPETDTPETSALAALMCFTAARLPARTDDGGALLLPASQDRTRWDRHLAAEGVAHLRRAARGTQLTPLHLEAEIAAHHTLAPTFEATPWAEILKLYDLLMRAKPSPVIAVNRAVVLGRVAGAAAGLAALESLAASRLPARYYPYHVALGAALAACGRTADARTAYRAALACGPPAPVCRHIDGLLATLPA